MSWANVEVLHGVISEELKARRDSWKSMTELEIVLQITGRDDYVIQEVFQENVRQNCV